MKKTASTIVIAGTVCAVALFAYLNSQGQSSTCLFMQERPLEKEFAQFVTHHKRSFGTRAEYVFRRDIFAKKFKEIEEFNKKGASSTVAVNKFSDWTEDEIKRMLGYKPDENRVKNFRPMRDGEGENASPIDWRDKGAVTDVKD